MPDNWDIILNFITKGDQAKKDTEALAKSLEGVEQGVEDVNQATSKGSGEAGRQAEQIKVVKREETAILALKSKQLEIGAKLTRERIAEGVAARKLKEFEARGQEGLAEIFSAGGVAEGFKGVDPMDIASIKAEILTQNARAMGIEFKESFINLVEGGKSGEQALQHLKDEFKGLYLETTAGQTTVDKAFLEHSSKTAAIMQTQARLLNIEVTQMRARAAAMTRVSNSISQVSRIGLAAGIGVVGGIFAAANKYVANAKEATTVTLEWKASQESLAKSGARVGAVLAQTALPLLKTAAEIAEKASAYIEKHPEIVQAAINAGLIVAGLSAVGLMVSKGIKMYADALYLASVPLQMQAAKLQATAAAAQLTAAKLRAKMAGVEVLDDVPTKGTLAGGGKMLAGFLAPAAAAAIGLSIGAIAGDKIFDAIEGRDVKFADYITTVKQAMAIDAKRLGDFFGKNADYGLAPGQQAGKDLGIKWFEKMGIALGLLEDKSDAAAAALNKIPLGSAAASPQFEQVLKAYTNYRQEDLQLVQEHHAERKNIVADALKAEQSENIKYAASVTKINQKSAADIADARVSFTRANEKAELEYQESRAEVLRDGNQEIQDIEANLQETLRKQRLEGGDRLEELARSRDALGYVKEQRRQAREKNESIRDANLEIGQRRRDIGQRLADLQHGYEQEQAERLADYERRVLEIRENSQLQLAELREQHLAELNEIRLQKVEKIRELDAQFIEERKRKYDYFIQQVRDLDASLLGEKNLRDQYQTAMLSDLEAFLVSYKNGHKALLAQVGNIKTAGGLAGGGYAGYGTYVLGDAPGGGRGKPEYVMKGSTTSLAEKLLGGSITDERLLARLGGGRGNQKSVVYNDSRRIDSRISAADRNRIVEDTLQAVEEALR